MITLLFAANIILSIIVYCSIHRRLNGVEARLREFDRFKGVDFHLEVAKSVKQYEDHEQRWRESQ